MQIDFITCPSQIEEKLLVKHNVTLFEARQVMLGSPRIRFVEKGFLKGDDVYAAFGQTQAGRYLAVFFIYKPAEATAMIISSRDMTEKERKAYGKK
jgi:hypothetical protein